MMLCFLRWSIVIAFVFVFLPCIWAKEKLLLPICNNSDRWGYCDEDGKLIIPFQYRDAQKFEDGVAEVDDANWMTRYVDAHGNAATRKEDLQSYAPPLIRSEKVEGVPRLIHRDGRVVEFPEFRILFGYSDGCAIGKTNDDRGVFSRDPMNRDSWKCFSSGTLIAFYDEQARIISYVQRGTNVFRYLGIDEKEVRHLEESVKKYDWSSDSEKSRVVVVNKCPCTRYGVLSASGNEILPCEYDYVDVKSPYILAWKYGEGRKQSEVSFFDDDGRRNLKLTVDGDDWIKCDPSEGWHMFAIGGTNFWFVVGSNKKLHVDGDKVVVEQIQ